MKRLIVVLVALVVVVGAVYVGSQRLTVRSAEEPTPASLQTGPSRTSEVRCSGRVIPKRWLALSFGRSGRVARITVQEGASVQQGDVLAELVSEDLSLEVEAAEQRLQAAQAELAQAQATPAPEKLRAAQAALAAAEARLSALQAGPSATELETARLQVEQARNRLWGAQAARDSLGGTVNSGPAYEQAKAAVASAEIDLRLAEIAYEEVKAGASAEEIASAEADVARAQEALDAARTGATPEELALLQAGVAQARVEVEQAKTRQAEADGQSKITAPFAGTVTAINLQEGQLANAGAETVVLADLSELQIETIDLSELDVAAVSLGQPVEVVVPGSGSPVMQAQVSYISPQVTVSASGQALYRVLLTLNRPEPSLRWGMSATLSFGKRIR